MKSSLNLEVLETRDTPSCIRFHPRTPESQYARGHVPAACLHSPPNPIPPPLPVPVEVPAHQPHA